MNRVRLTNQRIQRTTCPAGKSQFFMWDSEVPHLALRVTKAGAKAYIYQGKLNRQTIRVTIGDPASWTLDKARQEARRLQTLIDRGIDPRDLKREQTEARETARKQAARAKEYTLAALMDLYADHCDDQGKQHHAACVRSATKCHLVKADPELAGTPAKDITPEQIAGLVRRVTEAGKGRTAGMLRSCLHAAYNCGLRAPLSSELPAAFIPYSIKTNPVVIVPAIPVKARNRTLSRDELKAYLEALDHDDRIDYALRLAVYAGGQRMSQLLRARVDDYDRGTQTLRLWDAKGKRQEPREHIVPLGSVGADTVDKLLAMSEKSGLLFPSSTGTKIHNSNPGKRASEISQQMGGEAFNLLDIRRTVETMLAGMGVSRDVRAQLLSHGITGVQAVHYDRYDYLKEKRAAIRKWEAYLKRLLTGENEETKVIPLRGLQS